MTQKHILPILFILSVITYYTVCAGEIENPNIGIPSKEVNQILNKNPILTNSKQPKQDEDGDAAEAGAGVLGNVADQITKILTGAITGNLASIFSGSSGFIPGEGAKTVNTFLTDNVAKPIDNLVKDRLTQIQSQIRTTPSSNPGAIPAVAAAAAPTTTKATTLKSITVTNEDDEDDDEEDARVGRNNN